MKTITFLLLLFAYSFAWGQGNKLIGVDTLNADVTDTNTYFVTISIYGDQLEPVDTFIVVYNNNELIDIKLIRKRQP